MTEPMDRAEAERILAAHGWQLEECFGDRDNVGASCRPPAGRAPARSRSARWTRTGRRRSRPCGG